MGGGLFLEALKKKMKAEYDYILIDSRTSISGISGDLHGSDARDLVVCFTLNNQNLEGTAAVAGYGLQKQRGASGIRTFPVPTRIAC